MIYITTAFIGIYLLLVFRIYVLSSYYIQFDGVRHMTLFVPIFVLYTLGYMIYTKSYNLFKESILHPKQMYITISFQFLRDMNEKLK